MNKFKKPYSPRTGGSRPDSRAGARPASRPRFGAGPSARPSFGARSPRPEAFQKFDAICSNCGKKCQVPFRPDGQKPVYCKNCFGAPREALPALKRSSSINAAEVGSGASGAGGGAGGGKSIADLTRQIAAMNTKIDTMLKLLQNGGAEE